MSTTLSSPAISSSITAGLASGLLSGTVTHEPAQQTPAVGTNAGNVNLAYSADFTVSSGSPLTLDLSSIADAAGNTAVFGHVTHWLVENRSTNAAELMTLGGGSNPLIPARSGADVIQANGGYDLKASPNPGIVRDATHKTFQIAVASGTAVPGRLTILGRTT
jgi:hypothetical protein